MDLVSFALQRSPSCGSTCRPPIDATDLSGLRTGPVQQARTALVFDRGPSSVQQTGQRQVVSITGTFFRGWQAGRGFPDLAELTSFVHTITPDRYVLDRLASDPLSSDACMALDGKDGPSAGAGRSSRGWPPRPGNHPL